MERTPRLSQHYGPGRFGLSIELYPPKSPAGEADLFTNMAELATFKPSFVTCTYGAGGSTRDKTLDIVGRVHREFGLPVASHLTCVGATADELRTYIREAQAVGVDYIVALRGDPPKGEEAFKPVNGGFSNACDLVGMISLPNRPSVRRCELGFFGKSQRVAPRTCRSTRSNWATRAKRPRR